MIGKNRYPCHDKEHVRMADYPAGNYLRKCPMCAKQWVVIIQPVSDSLAAKLGYHALKMTWLPAENCNMVLSEETEIVG